MKKRNKLTALALTLSSLLLVGCAAEQQAQLENISLDTAKETAIQQAEIPTEARVVYTSAELDERDGKRYYDIEFIAEGLKYEYDIDALTGIVIEEKKPEKPEKDEIDEDVLTEVEIDEIWEEYKESKAEIEKIEAEAEYDKSQLTENIMVEDTSPSENSTTKENSVIQENSMIQESSTSTTSSLNEQQAKDIALAQVPGATVNDIREFEVDHDDGRIAYEGTIIYGEMEYEFEIDGYSGAIREWDVESIYD